MANLFRCGGSSVEEPKSVVFSTISIDFTQGSNAFNIFYIPDDVKTVKIGRIYTSSSNIRGEITIGLSSSIKKILEFGSNQTSCTIDMSQYTMKNLTINVFASGSSTATGGATLKDVEFIF